MRHRSILFFAALAFGFLAVFSPASSRADIFDDYGDSNDSFDFQAEVGLASRRLFRGQDLYDGTSVQPRLRAQANVDIFSVYIEGFSHIATEDSHDDAKPEFSELDYDLGAFTRLDDLTVHFGHRWYSYTKKTARLDNTGEFFTKLQLDAVIQPHLEVDYDWDTYRGWYSELGAEVPVPITDQTSVIPFATLSFSTNLEDGTRPIYAENGFVALDFGIRGQMYAVENVYVEPELRYTSAFDDAADNVFTFGIRLGAKASSGMN